MRPVDADEMLKQLKPIDGEMENSAVLISDMSRILRNWVERQPTMEIEKELEHVKAERDAAMKDLQKWNVCATCKHYKPHSKKSHCEIKEAYLPGGNWAGCSKWEWKGIGEDWNGTSV